MDLRKQFFIYVMEERHFLEQSLQFEDPLARIWGEWPSGLGHYNLNWKVSGSNLTRCLTRISIKSYYKAPGDL